MHAVHLLEFHSIVTALQRRDENGDVYDLTRVCFDELL
jgi:hypothetical protein